MFLLDHEYSACNYDGFDLGAFFACIEIERQIGKNKYLKKNIMHYLTS